MLDNWHATVTIRFESGEVTDVETETRQTWRYRDLPDEMDHERLEVADNA